MATGIARPATRARIAQIAEVEVNREERIGIGTDGVESDVAQIEQAGEPDHDVEPPAQHHIGQHQDAEIKQVAVVVEQRGYE